MSTDQLALNKKLVTDFIAALSSAQPARVMALLTDDSQYLVTGKGPMAGAYSKEQFKDLYISFCALFPTPMTLKPVSMVAEGDAVACEAVSFGVTSAGRTYQNAFHILFEIRGEKIHRAREYLDTAHAAEVFGP